MKLKLRCPYCGHGTMHHGEAMVWRRLVRNDLFHCRGCGSAYEEGEIEAIAVEYQAALRTVRQGRAAPSNSDTPAAGNYLKCPQCGRAGTIVNECGCDPDNLPTRVRIAEEAASGGELTLAETGGDVEIVRATCDAAGNVVGTDGRPVTVRNGQTVEVTPQITRIGQATD